VTRRASAARLAIALAAALACASGAAAHPLAPSLLELREGADGGAEVLWRTPARLVPGARLRPLLPGACPVLVPPRERRVDGSLVRTWRIACPAPGLVGRRLGVAGVAASRADVVLRVELADGRALTRVLRRDAASVIVPERPRRRDVTAGYLGLGFEHIAGGVDHLLFVLALILLVRSRRALLLTVTAFTGGHSVTLALAVLGLVAVPGAAVEAAIAASILVAAVELAGEGGAIRRFPWLVAGAFGLLHGLGFAGALAEVGLPQGEIPLALLVFNVGIELGQLGFIALVLAVRAALLRFEPSPSPGLARVPAYAIGSLAAFWLFERLAAVF
jgi:hypothetical protein